MSASKDLVERIKTARIERDRIIDEHKKAIDETHKRFASMLDAERAKVEIDADDQPKRASSDAAIAAAAGFSSRTYLFKYIPRYLSPKK